MIQRLVLLPALAGILGGLGAAQLDLPRKPSPRPPEPGEVLLPPPPPRGDVAPKEERDPLDLPAPPGAGPVTPAPVVEGAPDEAAALFQALTKTRDPRAADATLGRLLALGPPALAAARAALESEHGPTLAVAGRLCLRAGEAAERAAVAERLRRPVPAEVGLALLAELRERDPVLSSPEYLAGLLEHPVAALRTAAVQALEARPGVPLQALAPVLASSRTAARAAALELVARDPDPLAWNLVASRLGDPSAPVARRAAELLADLDGAEPLLLERAFPPAERIGPLEWDRKRAYALLGVIEREERRGTALLEGSSRGARVESLRAGLTSVQPLVAGAAAVALARIGFRASAGEVGSWLAREVPHQLVRAGTGAEFHADFSSLERPALRALALLSGESFGADGEAWRRWWVEQAEGFRPRHARIELGPRAARQLVVSFRDERERTWWLCAREATASPGAAPVLRLAPEGAERLVARLAELGVFGPERLPGSRGSGEWAVTAAIGDEEKAWGPGADAAWLAEIRGALAPVVEENLWQLHFDPRATTAEAWWDAQHQRWAGLEPLARRRALATLLLEAARRTPPEGRDELVAQLARLYEDAGVPAAEDFEPLLGVLAGEPGFGPRAAELCELARVAAASAPSESAAGERLLALGLERFGPEADGALARVARDLDPSTLALLATDARPRARGPAARGLERAGDRRADSLARLRALLADREPGVVLAVLEALGASADPGLAAELAGELLTQARTGAPEVRLAALAVLARTGSKEAHDLALEAVGDGDEAVQRAGVEALAELADPRSASLLASLFARGPSSLHYAAARRGLQRLGPAGREECLRLARSASARARREAALFLAEALDPEAPGLLLVLLAEDPGDERVLWELGVLAGLDFAAEAEPAGAVADWWDLVVHDDPLAWLLAAAERAGVPAPPREVLAERTNPAGAHFLLRLLESSAPVLVERAARELEARLGAEFPRPATAGERAHFVAALRDAVRARLGE